MSNITKTQEPAEGNDSPEPIELWRPEYENVNGRLEFVKASDLFVWACVNTRTGEVDMEVERYNDDLPDVVEGWEWRRFRLVETNDSETHDKV